MFIRYLQYLQGLVNVSILSVCGIGHNITSINHNLLDKEALYNQIDIFNRIEDGLCFT